jgi:hypothetical protein
MPRPLVATSTTSTASSTSPRRRRTGWPRASGSRSPRGTPSCWSEARDPAGVACFARRSDSQAIRKSGESLRTHASGSPKTPSRRKSVPPGTTREAGASRQLLPDPAEDAEVPRADQPTATRFARDPLRCSRGTRPRSLGTPPLRGFEGRRRRERGAGTGRLASGGGCRAKV